jgi:hypothetical protein
MRTESYNSRLCSRRMRTARHAYFAGFSPDALAILSEATLLAYKSQAYLGMDEGFFWAAIRCIERGEARCDILRLFDSQSIEREYKAIIRKFDSPRSMAQVELHQFYNSLTVLAHRCRPDEPAALPCFGVVTSGMVLAAIIAKFDFCHAANVPLRRAGIDVRHAFEVLRSPGGFQAGESVIRRGQLPPDRLALHTRASEMAAFIGSWIITSTIANAAVYQLDLPRESGSDVSIRKQWAELIRHARSHVNSDGCCFLLSFPGPHPWTAAAASILRLDAIPE